MKNYLIAERYASGLSSAIEDNDALEPAVAALWQFRELYETNHDFRNVLANPAIDSERRAAVLADVLKALEVPTVVARLAEVLLRRGRISVLPDVAEVFSALADSRLNRLRATVTTAAPISEAEEARLAAVLEAHTGKTIRMECAVDSEILGGVVARMGSEVIDGSVRTRLDNLRTALLTEES
jgi:F-type H+-transporting ATPase subunit delta